MVANNARFLLRMERVVCRVRLSQTLHRNHLLRIVHVAPDRLDKMVQGSLLLHKADDEKKHGAKSSYKQNLHRRPTSHAGMHLDLEIFLVIGLVVDSWSLIKGGVIRI